MKAQVLRWTLKTPGYPSNSSMLLFPVLPMLLVHCSLSCNRQAIQRNSLFCSKPEKYSSRPVARERLTGCQGEEAQLTGYRSDTRFVTNPPSYYGLLQPSLAPPRSGRWSQQAYLQPISWKGRAQPSKQGSPATAAVGKPVPRSAAAQAKEQ